MSLAPDVFRHGLAAWVSSPRVQAAWKEGGGEEPPDGWGWEWEWREEEVGGRRGTPFASLCLTRTHRVKGEEEESGEAEAFELELESYANTGGGEEGAGEGVGEDGEEDACALPTLSPSSIASVTEMVVVDWELHIVYNEIYNTPTLWLKATRSDGVPLRREEVARLCGVGVGEGEGEEEGGWTVLSQDEHPTLGRPFIFLHPCGTPGRMARLLTVMGEMVGEQEDDDNEEKNTRVGLTYLVKWFGLVAPVLGLRFPPPFVQAMLLL